MSTCPTEVHLTSAVSGQDSVPSLLQMLLERIKRVPEHSSVALVRAQHHHSR